MRIRSLLLAAACLATVSCTSPRLTDIPFATTQQRFEPGDAIVVEHVLASSTPLAVGDRVMVRGTYTLRSRTEARLGLSLNTAGPSVPTLVAPGSRTAIVQGTGRFALECEVQAPGRLHVSFYPAGSGGSFGSVYFASVDR